MTTTIVQWTTGNVGKRSVRAVVAHPDLELVGCYAWSPDKVGRDVGELCGIDPVGVTATERRRRAARAAAGLRRLQPDVAGRRRARPHPRGRRQRREHRRVHQRPWQSAPTATASSTRASAAASSMFGTGISPGFVELIAIATANICDRIDKITINEAVRHHALRLPRRPSCRAGSAGPSTIPSSRAWRPRAPPCSARRWPGRRRARRRARRDRLRSRVREDDRGRRDGLVDDPGGLRRRRRRQLAGPRRRPHRRRANVRGRRARRSSPTGRSRKAT